MQIATAATFSAAWLEALRMGFALLERPDGSLASPFLGDAALSLPTLLVLLPAAAPAAMAGDPPALGTLCRPDTGRTRRRTTSRPDRPKGLLRQPAISVSGSADCWGGPVAPEPLRRPAQRR